jgi:hypothetical protein
LAVDQYGDGCLAPLFLLGAQPGARQEPVRVADLDPASVDECRDAPARDSGERLRRCDGQRRVRAAVAMARAERVLGPEFCRCGHAQLGIFVESGTGQRADGGQVRGAFGEGAGLVEGDPAGGAETFHDDG